MMSRRRTWWPLTPWRTPASATAWPVVAPAQAQPRRVSTAQPPTARAMPHRDSTILAGRMAASYSTANPRSTVMPACRRAPRKKVAAHINDSTPSAIATRCAGRLCPPLRSVDHCSCSRRSWVLIGRQFAPGAAHDQHLWCVFSRIRPGGRLPRADSHGIKPAEGQQQRRRQRAEPPASLGTPSGPPRAPGPARTAIGTGSMVKGPPPLPMAFVGAFSWWLSRPRRRSRCRSCAGAVCSGRRGCRVP